jgi:hypothetical protein
VSADWQLDLLRKSLPEYAFTREAGQIVASRAGERTIRDTSHEVILAILMGRRDAAQSAALPSQRWRETVL